MVTLATEVRGVKEGQRIGKRVVAGKLFSVGLEKGTAKRVWSLVAKCDCGRCDVVRIDGWKQQKQGGCPDCCGGRKHGDWNERLYAIWCGMRRRCNSAEYAVYNRYGGRGIAVCDEWQNYAAFRSWANSSGYREPLTIDRIDNDGNYEPSNCQWLTLSENVQKMHEYYGHKINKRN